MTQPDNQKDSPIWFLYIYGGFAVIGSLIYLGKTGKILPGLTLLLAMLLSIGWLCLLFYHFFKKRPKKPHQIDPPQK
jgi:hypothetical protein